MDSLPTSLRIPILRRLAADGDAQARYALGSALRFGSDVDEDEAEGLRLLERAAEAGLPHAQRSLARRLREDESLPADLREERARSLERKAARAGCPLATRTLADHEIDAIGD